jgi:hypothetical protein
MEVFVATAPDWATRVAREIYREFFVAYEPRPHDIARMAALIRVAGSERERELRTVFKQAIRFLPHTLDEICHAGDCTRCKVLAEASRLL